MIRRIAVTGYKSLRDVELTLKPLTVIIGPNATGKSNLFDALHLLKRIVRSRTLAEAFEEHRGDPIEAFSFGAEGISGLLKQEEARFTLEVDVELSLAAFYYTLKREHPLQFDNIQRVLRKTLKTPSLRFPLLAGGTERARFSVPLAKRGEPAGGGQL